MNTNPTPATVLRNHADALNVKATKRAALILTAVEYASGKGKYRDLRRSGDLMGSRIFLAEKFGTDVAESVLRELKHV